MLEKILKEVFGEDNVQKVLVEHKPPTQPEDYESLITPEEYEALIHVVNAMDSFHKVRNEILDSRPQEEWDNASPHAKMQYLFYNDMIEFISDKLYSVYTVHTINKERIESQIPEDMTLEEVVEMFTENTMKRKAKEILDLLFM